MVTQKVVQTLVCYGIAHIQETTECEIALQHKQLRNGNQAIISKPRCEKTGLRGFRSGPDTNQAVQLQKMARDLKCRI